MLKQKERVEWLKEGDRNSKFFHQAIQKRRVRNSIKKLISNGRLSSDPLEIKHEVKAHLQQVFRKRKEFNIFSVKGLISHKLSKLEADLLERSAVIEEVELALVQSGSDKDPGPHGLNAGVLKALWRYLKDYMLAFVNNFMSKGEIPLATSNTIGLGVVIRDHRGAVVMMVSGTIRGLTMIDSELWALLIGLRGLIEQFEKRKSDPNLTLEVDTIRAIQNRLARFLAVDGAQNRNRLGELENYGVWIWVLVWTFAFRLLRRMLQQRTTGCRGRSRRHEGMASSRLGVAKHGRTELTWGVSSQWLC
ncbi:hypothetical protein POM88_036289 [Heracleum sosnowskyi]|uniref:RNase H type-1 domain-containing protein n=1 Tax=Heracleum sosnowskyi TaxID=360622 RepID=A0AAD8HPX2_9APIA|nr:hypothetical protein POM88_036289 [Heracleum sosnowskyi]